MDYVKDFLYYGINGEPVSEADIGIISPYKKQYQCIQEQLNLRKWFKIETGAVESFQGREKPIIIVSFVRSRTETLGFLKNPRRLNVTISRAKSLLILIGNAQTLSMNEDFAHIIDMCRRRGSFRGEEFKKNPNKSFLKSMEDLTLEEQQKFYVKRVTKNRRYAFVRKTGYGKYNAVAGRGEGDNVIEQAKNNNNEINDRRQSRRSGYEKRQGNVKSVNVSKDGAKSVEKQSKLNVTNIESLFNELPKVPQLVKTAASNESKGINSVKVSAPHTSHLNCSPIANPFIGMTNNNVNFNNQGFYNAHNFQMPPMGNGPSQMQAAGNGFSQMRLTGNQPSQLRPMFNGLPQMQSTGNGPPQMRPKFDISSQMRSVGNVPQQMRPKCNVPSQTGPVFNGSSQMPPICNGPPRMEPTGNGPQQMRLKGNQRSQTQPMFNGSSQMQLVGNGPSQMQPTGNRPPQTRPMFNGSSQMQPVGNKPSQMQPTGNRPPQTRPMFNGSSQMQPVGNKPSQMQPMGNGPPQTRPTFNGSSQMQPVGNKPSQMQPTGNGPPQTRPMFNGPSQMPGYNSSSTVNNSNFQGSSIPSMSAKIKYDKSALLDIRKEMTTTTAVCKADKHQTSNSLTDNQQHKNYKHILNTLNTDSATSTPNLLAKTSAKQSTRQSSSTISDNVKNNKTATSSCGTTVAETVTAVSAVRQTMISTTPSSQQNKPNTSTDRKSSSNDPASPPVKSDILANLSIQQSNLTNNMSSSTSTASSNRPLDGNTTTSNSTARSGSADSTSYYSGNPLISKPTTTNSGVLTAATGSSQLASKRQSSPVVCITTRSEATNHRTTYAHTSAELTSSRIFIKEASSQISPIACITTRSEASNHRTNYAYTSAELNSNRAAYSPQRIYYETVTRPESNLRSSNQGRTTTKKDSGCQIS
uniref:DNA2/NAM7 helicase-like C-terminal domain-containing protein n=1 Tax=Glossina austeni TaxID=7395 RepID=A0A1A9UGZ5_GLOAU